MASVDNPLLALSDPYPFDRIEPAHIAPAIDELVTRARAAVDRIASQTGAVDYASTLGALDTETEALERAALVCEHLEGTATTDALRAAWTEAQPKVSAFWSELPLHAGLYAVLRRVADAPSAAALSPIEARHLKKTLDEFKRHGAELDEAGKKRLSAIDVELTQLTTKFSQNTLDSTNAYELVIEDEAKIAGLPPLAKAGARASAEAKGKAGFRFTLHAPSFIPAITHVDDPTVRAELYRAYNERGSRGEHDNRPLIVRILELRREKARLLGFDDFADLVVADRMAKRGKIARDFLADLRGRTQAAFDAEKKALATFAGRKLDAWDVAYYSEKQRKALYDFDEEALRPYFPLEAVLEGVFEILRRLYGVRFAPKDLPRWDALVRPYHLEDEAGAHLATVYLDLFPRENKVQGAWMGPLSTAVPGSPHLAVVAANFTPAVGDTPALLSHREVETLFHELGHLMHQCLSRVPVRKLGGASVAWDFVELPSQIMENWCWEREAVDLFGKHYQSGELLPQELFDKLARARTYRAASIQMQQLGYAETDLDLHCSYDPKSGEDPVARARTVMQAHVTAELPPTFSMITGFGHLFASPVGYAGGYYSYKWAEVLDADAFGRFREEGLFSRKVGEAFRDAILARGDSADPDQLYREFRGRDPKLDALLARLGLDRVAA